MWLLVPTVCSQSYLWGTPVRNSGFVGIAPRPGVTLIGAESLMTINVPVCTKLSFDGIS